MIGKNRLKKLCGFLWWKDWSSLLGNSLNLGLPRHLFGEPWGSLFFWRVYRSGHHNLPSSIARATRPAELRSDVRQPVTVFCSCRSCYTANEPGGDKKGELRKGDRRQSRWTWVIDSHNSVSLRTSVSLLLLFLKLHPCRFWVATWTRVMSKCAVAAVLSACTSSICLIHRWCGGPQTDTDTTKLLSICSAHVAKLMKMCSHFAHVLFCCMCFLIELYLPVHLTGTGYESKSPNRVL